MKIWLSVCTAFLLAGCVTVPERLRGEFPAITPQTSVERGLDNQRVRWGGEIVKTLPGRDETCFEVIGQYLNEEARPITDDNSQGRFIACARGFYDPAVYTQGRDLTVVGTLDEVVVRKIGDFDYRYPQVSAQQVYLWPNTYEYYGYGNDYDPFFSLGFYSHSFYPGFYPRHYRDRYYRDHHYSDRYYRNPGRHKPRQPDRGTAPDSGKPPQLGLPSFPPRNNFSFPPRNSYIPSLPARPFPTQPGFNPGRPFPSLPRR